MPTYRERIEGGLIGLLVGDALGVPYEFHPPKAIPEDREIEFAPPRGFSCGHAGVPPGTWSDDGALALCLLASLQECERFDPSDFGQRLVRWYDEGYMAVDGILFDIGGSTEAGIAAIRTGARPLDAGPRGEHDCGNGALMRVLPLALLHKGTDVELVRDARLQSRLTHGHLRSQVCCALYVLWARRILQECSDPWRDAMGSLRALLSQDLPALCELDERICPDESAELPGSGYVIDCLRSARWCVEQGSYEQVVRAAIRLGHDTDTTACVAGGIAGLRDGIGGIPERWVSGLRGRSLLQPLLDRLLAGR